MTTTTNTNHYETAAKIALFLTERTGSCIGTWEGRLSADEQRALFGAYVYGRKNIRINGDTESVEITWKIAFGMDYVHIYESWHNLHARSIEGRTLRA